MLLLKYLEGIQQLSTTRVPGPGADDPTGTGIDLVLTLADLPVNGMGWGEGVTDLANIKAQRQLQLHGVLLKA